MHVAGVDRPSSTVSSPSTDVSLRTITSTVCTAPSALPIGKVTVRAANEE